MSASTVIADVTETLADILRTEQQPQGSFSISLYSPAEDEISQNASGPTINLYLFRIEENVFAKNQEFRALGAERVQFPPLAVNLFYVVTPYAKEQKDGYRVLGEAMRIMHINSILQRPFLRGLSLEHSAEELKIDLCSFGLEELTRVWNAFNKPYRLSVIYQTRVILIDSQVERNIERVTEKENRHI